MAFMQPEYAHEDFVEVESKWGEGYAIPLDAFDEGDLEEEDEYEVVKGKWWVRLQAPGYLDATEWDGPFDTEQEARDHVEEFWEVDPDTGDDLEY